VCNKHFEVVKEFVYLGSLMTPTNDVSLEILRRIQTANRCFFKLRKHLQSSHLSRQTKFTIHKTLIRPVLLYGSETWVLTKKEENQLLVCVRKVLQRYVARKSKMHRKNKHVEGLFYQFFKGLVKDIQIVVSVVCDNRHITADNI
jgi:hypothetical protein